MKDIRQCRNKFEKETYKFLKKNKIKFDYEGQRIPYVIAGHYIPDFILTTRLGKVYVETKGYLRPEDKRKLVAVKSCNPGLDIRILFYRFTKQNVRWAERHGFRYAFEVIPKEWLLGL